MENFEYYYLSQSKHDVNLELTKEDKDENGNTTKRYYRLKYSLPTDHNYTGSTNLALRGGFTQYIDIILRNDIVDIIQQLNVGGIQLIPVEIADEKGNVFTNYTSVKASNTYKAMDKEKSQFEYYEEEDDEEGEEREEIVDPNKIWQLYLDENILKKIPLNDRLIFRLDESCTVYYHKSVVDAILAKYPNPYSQLSMMIINSKEYNG